MRLFRLLLLLLAFASADPTPCDTGRKRDTKYETCLETSGGCPLSHSTAACALCQCRTCAGCIGFVTENHLNSSSMAAVDTAETPPESSNAAGSKDAVGCKWYSGAEVRTASRKAALSFSDWVAGLVVSLRFAPGTRVDVTSDGGGHNKWFTTLVVPPRLPLRGQAPQPAADDSAPERFEVRMEPLPRTGRPIPLALTYEGQWSEPDVHCAVASPSPPPAYSNVSVAWGARAPIAARTAALPTTASGASGVAVLSTQCHTSVQWKAKLLGEAASSGRRLARSGPQEPPQPAERSGGSGGAASTAKNVTVVATLVLGQWIDGGLVRATPSSRAPPHGHT